MNITAAISKLNELYAEARKAKQFSALNLVESFISKLEEFDYYISSGTDMSDMRYPTPAAWFSEMANEEDQEQDVIDLCNIVLAKLNS